MIRIGQRWSDVAGQAWRVAHIYRADGYALLQRPGSHELRPVSFDELGRAYEPEA